MKQPSRQQPAKTPIPPPSPFDSREAEHWAAVHAARAPQPVDKSSLMAWDAAYRQSRLQAEEQRAAQQLDAPSWVKGMLPRGSKHGYSVEELVNGPQRLPTEEK